MPKAQRVDATSAEDKSIGFDYQYYYFLNELLNLKMGMTIGLEVMDDVHTELNNDTQVLVQLKHTVQTRADSDPKNLTTMDTDLWKSLSNWAKVISDPAADRSDTNKQLDFVNRTRFLLASNKSDNENNLLLKSVRDYQSKNISHKQLSAKIRSIKECSKNEVIQNYIADVLGLSPDISKIYFNHLSFDLGCEEIIAKCKNSIREHHIADNRVDDVFRALDSDVRSKNFELVKSKKKIIVTFDDFRKNSRSHFDKARNDRLVVRRFTDILPEKMIEQIFIQQLLEINDFEPDDAVEITRLTIQLLTARNNTDRWIKDADITITELRDLEEEVIAGWKNKFKMVYRRKATDENVVKAALSIVDALREKMLKLQEQDLGTDISNGVLYELSNRPEIGWMIDWEEKYK